MLTCCVIRFVPRRLDEEDLHLRAAAEQVVLVAGRQPEVGGRGEAAAGAEVRTAGTSSAARCRRGRSPTPLLENVRCGTSLPASKVWISGLAPVARRRIVAMHGRRPCRRARTELRRRRPTDRSTRSCRTPRPYRSRHERQRGLDDVPLEERAEQRAVGLLDDAEERRHGGHRRRRSIPGAAGRT